MKKIIEIVDAEDSFTVRVNDVLLYNYHSTALKAIRIAYGRNELVRMILTQNETLFSMFIEQLRREGYFDENR